MPHALWPMLDPVPGQCRVKMKMIIWWKVHINPLSRLSQLLLTSQSSLKDPQQTAAVCKSKINLAPKVKLMLIFQDPLDVKTIFR